MIKELIIRQIKENGPTSDILYNITFRKIIFNY